MAKQTQQPAAPAAPVQTEQPAAPVLETAAPETPQTEQPAAPGTVVPPVNTGNVYVGKRLAINMLNKPFDGGKGKTVRYIATAMYQIPGLPFAATAQIGVESLESGRKRVILTWPSGRFGNADPIVPLTKEASHAMNAWEATETTSLAKWVASIDGIKDLLTQPISASRTGADLDL